MATDFGIQPYINKGEPYVDEINTTTRSFLKWQGRVASPVRPYFEDGLPEMVYNADGSGDPLSPVLTPILSSAPSRGSSPASPIPLPMGCSGPSGSTLLCVSYGTSPIYLQFTNLPRDEISKVEIIQGNGAISYNPSTHIVAYTPSASPVWPVTIKATTINGSTCYAYLASDDSCCSCAGGIGYTTQQMQVNGTQSLTVTGAVADCVARNLYTWSVKSGGGSVSPMTGVSTVYTAPATNADCSSNPTIALSCKGVEIATLKLAVNAYVKGGGDPVCEEATYLCHHDQYSNILCATKYWCRGMFTCSGVPHPKNPYCGAVYGSTYCPDLSSSGANAIKDWDCTACSPAEGHADVRTATMITRGCCPSTLL